MEYISAIGRAVITLMVALVYNRIISLFRGRRLYATLHTMLENYDKGEIGSTFIVVFGNAGKDKEKGVVLHFPKNKKCKLISRNYPGISVKGSNIFVDRVLPGEKVSACVFLGGEKPVKDGIPTLRSEDAKGKVYNGYGKESINPGPYIVFFSILFAVMSTMVYSSIGHGNAFEPFYKLRYWNFYESGFKPWLSSDNELIGSYYPLSSSYPLVYDSARKQDEAIYVSFKLTNTTGNLLRVVAEFEHDWSDYYDAANVVYADMTISAGEKLGRVAELEKLYGIPTDDMEMDELEVKPGESVVFEIGRPITEKLTVKNFLVEVVVTGEDIRDRYRYQPPEGSLSYGLIEALLNE